MLLPLLAVTIICSSPPSKSYYSFDQLTEVVDKLTKSARQSRSMKGILKFNESATVLAGAVTQNSKFLWTFKSQDDSPYVIYKEAWGNDYELKIDVTAGIRAVTITQDDYCAKFLGRKGVQYTISVTNKGADTFAGIAIFKTHGGLAHPLNGMAKAAKVMAKSIENSQKDGLRIPNNIVSLIGTVVRPNSSAIRPSANTTRWSAISTSDSAIGSTHLVIQGRDKQVLQDDNGEAEDCVAVFNKPVPSGTVQVKNVGSRSSFVLTMILSKG